MKVIIDIEKVTELLELYIDPYEIPGAMCAIMKSSQELEFVEEEHNDTQISDK